MGYNTNFEMGLKELEIVEDALRFRLNQLSKSSTLNSKTCFTGKKEISEIQSVLGSLHNQKLWYRPTDTPYVSG
ncbi:hypothetical protein GN286_06210 [Rhodobacteraceae bacterium IMCC15231]|nr:hypothetical protein [Rhodobacteraceae bacterium IMCC15231]